jgi:hypothetical protein
MIALTASYPLFDSRSIRRLRGDVPALRTRILSESRPGKPNAGAQRRAKRIPDRSIVLEATDIATRLRRAALTAALAAGGLGVHLVVQRLAPPPLWRAGEPLVGVVPFLPWTIWIYLLFFPLLVVTGALQSAGRWRRLALAWSLASAASWALVLLVPVTFARPDPRLLDPLHAWVLGRVYALDAAHVTFPCLHSAVTWICWYALRDRGPRLRAVVLVLAIAIPLSTMTTRQHLLTDNAAALVIAWACARTVRPRSGASLLAADQGSAPGAASGSRS